MSVAVLHGLPAQGSDQNLSTKFNEMNPAIRWGFGVLLGGGIVYLVLTRTGLLDQVLGFFIMGVSVFAGFWAFGFLSDNTVEVVEAIGRGGKAGYDSIRSGVTGSSSAVNFSAPQSNNASVGNASVDILITDAQAPGFANADSVAVRFGSVDYPLEKGSGGWSATIEGLTKGKHNVVFIAQVRDPVGNLRAQMGTIAALPVEKIGGHNLNVVNAT